MEDYNKNDKNNGFLRDESVLVRIFLFILYFIFLILLVYIVGVLILTRDHYKSDTADADRYFGGCSLLKKDCTDANCSFYNSCDGAKKACVIYDCGGEYGIFTKNDDGQISTKRKAKPDMTVVETEREACRGNMEILEQNCINDTYQTKVKITPKGQCKIGNFVVIFENEGSQPNKFTMLEDNVYAITVDHCGKATEISPVSASGIYLEF